jgi:hypothetical protein
MRILITGASGKIAGQILPAFRERYALVLLDVKTTNRAGEKVKGIQIADLTDKNRDAYRHFFQGVDAVVHCGRVRNSNPRTKNDADVRFWTEIKNVEMAYNVYQTALEEGVRRVVMASSNHAANYYEPLILDGKWDFVNPDDRALSNSYYGWSKVVYEHLGFVFAVGEQTGKPLENVHIRIGGPRETDVEQRVDLGDLRAMRRALAVYISDRDMQQLFIKSIETENITNEQGIPFQIFYGISNNSHAYWSIANARKVIGYTPEDNSELRFADLIAKHLQAAAEIEKRKK